MALVIDKTAECMAISRTARRARGIDGPVFGRMDCVDDIRVHQHDSTVKGWATQIVSAVDLTECHATLDLRTGHKSPYGTLVRSSGLAEQMVPLGLKTPHAWRMSARSYGLVFVWPFRMGPPPDECLLGLAKVSAYLCRWYGLGPNKVVGHTETPGATMYQGKVCPDPAFSMGWLREMVAERIPDYSPDETPESHGFARWTKEALP